MNLGFGLLGLAVFLHLMMALAWAIALKTGRSGFIDAFWSLSTGAGGVLAALLPFWEADALPPRRFLAAAMAALWSLRLGLHILQRTVGGADDPRYAKMKQDWGKKAPQNLFAFLQAQAVAAWPLVLAVLLASRNPRAELGGQDLLGLTIFIAAFAGESVSDRQLAAFRANPANKGKICDTGLWGRCRHPNYFFEWLGWVAYPVIAMDLSGGYPWGWLALGAPALMYYLLLYVSGIPPLEDSLRRSRPEAFRAYAAKTGPFWPRLI